MKLTDTYSDRQVEQAAVACSKEQFAIKTQPSLMLSSLVGNMYTPSLYAGLVSLLVKYFFVVVQESNQVI
jgi:hydroxymethylglutaryl-CoA synthase